MPRKIADRARRFCCALLEETRGEILRWAAIDSVADRLGMDPDKAAAMTVALGEAGLVRVGGRHSVILAEAGRQLAQDAAKPAPSSRQGRRQPAGASARDGGGSGKGRRRR